MLNSTGRPVARGIQVDNLHPLGVCNMSKTNMLIRSQFREGNITKLIQAKSYSNWQSARAATYRYVTGSHAKNAVLCFEYYRECVGALVRVLQCIPLLVTLSSLMVQKNISQTFFCARTPFGLKNNHGSSHPSPRKYIVSG